MHTIVKGDLTVAELTVRFIRLGWTVLKPVTELSRYDLAIDRGRGLERVQCKTGKLKAGRISFDACSMSRYGAKKYGDRRHYRGEIELFGVYCPDNDGAYLIPVDEVGITEGCLRVDETKNGQKAKVRWASDYELNRVVAQR